MEVWFQDEAPIGQQGTLTAVGAEKGSRPVAVKQTGYEWVHLFAAANPATRESSALIAPTVNTEVMNLHLEQLGKAAGAHKHVVLVLDGAGWHRSKGMRGPLNVTLFHQPPYWPELNPVERVWGWQRTHHLSNRAYKDYDELFAETRTAWNRLDETRLRSLCATSWLPPAK